MLVVPCRRQLELELGMEASLVLELGMDASVLVLPCGRPFELELELELELRLGVQEPVLDLLAMNQELLVLLLLPTALPFVGPSMPIWHHAMHLLCQWNL